MSRTAVVLVALLCASQFAPTLVPGPTAAIAEEEDASSADPIREAERLKDEARKYFNNAGNPDLSYEERKKNRKEAYVRLKKARGLLDAWIDEHPDDMEDLDALYVEIAGMLYWTKKEAAVGELESSKPTGAGASRTPSGRRPDKGEPPEKPEEAGVEPPEVEEPAGPTASDVLGEIEEYGNKHPGDVPGLHDMYKDFLARFPDPATDEYARAVERLETLGERLKDVYRVVRDDDPDSLEAVDDGQVKKLVKQLTQDLEKGDEPVRARAASYLGALGSGSAAAALIKALRREKDGEVFEACVDALAKIGGRRVCRRLLKVKPNSSIGHAVIEVLSKMVERGGVPARIGGEALATYVVHFNETTQEEATELLFEAGKHGAVGLSMCLHMAPTANKVEYIEALGEIGDPRTAGHLATFLVVNVSGARRKQAKAAREAIRKIGKPAVKYLIPVLDDERYNVWTAKLIQEFTGAKLKDDKRRTWEKWYRRNRKKLESDDS